MTEKEQWDAVQEVKATGGPAFPIGIPEAKIVYTGMTIRDYFAAKAMQSLLHSWTVNQKDDGEWAGDEHLAKESYFIADAMLKERLK